MTSSLADKHRNRPRKGTGQNRVALFMKCLDNSNGLPLVRAIDECACHMAQLAKEMANAGLIRRYDQAVPPSGITSKVARIIETKTSQ